MGITVKATDQDILWHLIHPPVAVEGLQLGGLRALDWGEGPSKSH